MSDIGNVVVSASVVLRGVVWVGSVGSAARMLLSLPFRWLAV